MAHKPSVPWKEGRYDERGALNPAQQTKLGAEFNLSEDQTRELSRKLGDALDPSWRARSLRDAKGGWTRGQPCSNTGHPQCDKQDITWIARSRPSVR